MNDATEAVAVIGPLPPPRGGVSDSVAGFCDAVRETGCVVRHVAPKDLTSQLKLIATSWSSQNRALVANVSTSSGLYAATVTATATRAGVRVVFIHGAILSRQFVGGTSLQRGLIRRALRCFDEVWVNNEMERAKWHSSLQGLEFTVVSPYCSPPTLMVLNDIATDRSVDLLCAEGLSDSAIYGLDLVVEAWEVLRKQRESLAMVALLYGGTQQATEARRRALERRGVTVCVDLEPDQVRGLLAKTSVLVRPTQRDGDSLMVREALAMNCRVLASGVAPRPLGCEVVDLTVTAIIDGIERGGMPADGSGLGIDPVEALFGRTTRN